MSYNPSLPNACLKANLKLYYKTDIPSITCTHSHTFQITPFQEKCVLWSIAVTLNADKPITGADPAGWVGWFDNVRSQKTSRREQKFPQLADVLKLITASKLQEITISSPLEGPRENLLSEDSRMSKGYPQAPRF